MYLNSASYQCLSSLFLNVSIKKKFYTKYQLFIYSTYFKKLKLSQFIRTRPLKFPSRPSHPKKFLSRPVIYFQNPIPSRWYLIPSRPDKNLLTGSRPVPTQCSGGDGDAWWWYGGDYLHLCNYHCSPRTLRPPRCATKAS